MPQEEVKESDMMFDFDQLISSPAPKQLMECYT